jgi:hypothetical protein
VSLLYSFIWAGISITVAIWLGENGYGTISFGFYIFAGLCFMHVYNLKKKKEDALSNNLKDDHPLKKAKITCQNCKKNELALDINIRKDAKMYFTDILYTMDDGTHVRPILCFDCSYISEFIGLSFYEVEYIKCYKLNIAMKDHFLEYAKSCDHKYAIKKIKNVKIEENNGCFPFIVFCMVGVCIYVLFGKN